MPKNKAYEMNTVIVDGDPNSFRAALSRSLMGVTFAKFARKRQVFYQNQNYNRAVTRSLFNTLHENLLNTQINFTRFKLKTYLKPNYENGKFSSLTDIKVSIYMKIGELEIDELTVHEEFKNIKINLFYTENTFASNDIRKEMPEIIKEMGLDSSDYNEHNFDSDKGKELAIAYGVKATPTIVINAGEKILENPNLKNLKQKLEDALSPAVTPTVKPRFVRDPELEANIASLSQVLNAKAPQT